MKSLRCFVLLRSFINAFLEYLMSIEDTAVGFHCQIQSFFSQIKVFLFEIEIKLDDFLNNRMNIMLREQLESLTFQMKCLCQFDLELLDIKY